MQFSGNKQEGHTFHIAARLRDAMAKDYHPQPEDPWMTWLTFGTWWHLMMKILTPILAVLLLLCLFTTCVVPCLREMIKSSMTQTLIAYQAIPHVQRIDSGYISRRMLEMELLGRRRRGRPKRRYMDAVKDDMQIVGVRVEDTKNRVKSKTVIRCGDP